MRSVVRLAYTASVPSKGPVSGVSFRFDPLSLPSSQHHASHAQGINQDWANIKPIIATHTVQTIELPPTPKTIHLGKPSKPTEEVHRTIHATRCTETPKATRK